MATKKHFIRVVIFVKNRVGRVDSVAGYNSRTEILIGERKRHKDVNNGRDIEKEEDGGW